MDYLTLHPPRLYALPFFRSLLGIGQSVYTQGANLDELMDNIREAVSLHLQEVLDAEEDISILVMSVKR